MTLTDDALRTAAADFIRQQRGGIIATLPADGEHPEAAWVHTALDEDLTVVFGTSRRSRKAINIAGDAHVSLVFVDPAGREAQAEGTARVCDADEAQRLGPVLAAAHPEGGGDPETAVLVAVELTWIRFLDLTADPQIAQELRP